jgi:hypothetical protein
VADEMKKSPQDRQFFTGALWIMASGSWQVRFTVSGNQGGGVLSIPVPATSSSTRGMQTSLGLMLGCLGLLLVIGVIGIVGAAARDAQLPPGTVASSQATRRSRIAMIGALIFTIAVVWFGDLWWKGEADSYARYVYKPLTMRAALETVTQGDQTLDLKIQDPGWLNSRKVDDFVLDHDHLMHLYLIRKPGMDVVYHLHPDQIAPGEFRLELPSIPAGSYSMYADVVHATGFPETLVTQLALPEIFGRPLGGDDAKGTASPLNPTGDANSCTTSASRFSLSDGYSMVWNNDGSLPAKTPQIFSFSLLDANGKPPSDMSLYMGMLGHAAFVKTDGTVFAHVHPSGTVSMAALMMAAAQNHAPQQNPDSMLSMPGMAMANGQPIAGRMPNSVGFPFGFPTAGAYRVFVQMKHGSTVETATFDACATSPNGK